MKDRVLEEMRGALRSELGAKTAYSSLAWRLSGTELEQVLKRMHSEEVELIESLRGILLELSGRALRRSLRRWLAAWLLTITTYLTGARFALRTCSEAEESITRWYLEFERYFAESGQAEISKQFGMMARIKQVHHQTLLAWVENMPRAR
jgi:rubrerythrin